MNQQQNQENDGSHEREDVRKLDEQVENIKQITYISSESEN